MDSIYPDVAFIRMLRETKKLGEEAIEKIEWRDAVRLQKIDIHNGDRP